MNKETFSKFIVSATSTDMSRPTLTGIEVSDYNGRRVAASTDGYRLHVETVDADMDIGVYMPVLDAKNKPSGIYMLDPDDLRFPDWHSIVPAGHETATFSGFVPKLTAARQLTKAEQHYCIDVKDGSYLGIVPSSVNRAHHETVKAHNETVKAADKTAPWQQIFNPFYIASALAELGDSVEITIGRLVTQPIMFSAHDARFAVIMPMFPCR